MALETLGAVSSRSGTLIVADFGQFGAWEHRPAAAAARAALAEGRYAFQHEGVLAVAVPGVPIGVELPVRGLRIDEGPFRGLWQAIFVDFVGSPHAARTIEAGHVIVDTARAGFFDVDGVASWKHEASVDGRADVVFWGLHGEEVARRFQAPALGDGNFGFVDLPVPQAHHLASQLEPLRSSGALRFAFDVRPHSHHYVMMKQVRARATESGVMGLAGQQAACGFMTSWGDGEFPVMLDFDEAGTLTRCGIFLATEQAQANLQAVQ